MSYFFIVNPRAGKRCGDIKSLIDSSFAGKKLEYEVHFTNARGHATELASRALIAGFDKIVAVGGDGTIRETAGPLVGKPVTLGIIPCGSGNGLARNIYMPLSPAAALKGLMEWEPRAIDAGLANGKLFLCSAGVGLDAEVAHDFNSMTGRRGILPYVWHAFWRILRYRPGEIVARVDGRELRITALVTAALNGVQYGGGARIAPGAYIDDGLLDLCSVKKASIPRLLAAVPSLFNGRLAEHKDIYSCWRGRVIDLDCLRPCWYHLDGEDFYAEDGQVRISVLPSALRVFAPKPVGDRIDA